MTANSIEPGDAEEVDVDKAGMPSIGRKKRGAKIAKFLMLATGAGVGIAWVMVGTGGDQQRAAKNAPPTNEVANRLAPFTMPDKPPPPPDAPPPARRLLDPPPPAGAGAKPAPDAKPVPHVATWEDRKFGFRKTENVPGQSAAVAGAPNAPDAGLGQSPDAPAAAQKAAAPDPLAARLEAPAIDLVRATLSPDPDYTVSAGRLLDCLMDTRTDSTLPGQMKCHLDSDVYSDSRRVKLMEAGTEFVGQQTGGILRGHERQFALFKRGKTPKGVQVNLNSPATDALGASGIEGWVDTQFGKRFGPALLIGVLQDATAIAVASQSSGRGQNTFVLGNTAQAGTSLAEKALEASVNIPEILHVRQGTRIQVMVARDLYFDVYKLERTAR